MLSLETITNLKERSLAAFHRYQEEQTAQQREKENAENARRRQQFKEALKSVLGLDVEPDGLSYVVDSLTFEYRPCTNDSLLLVIPCPHCGETLNSTHLDTYHAERGTLLFEIGEFLAKNAEDPGECWNCYEETRAVQRSEENATPVPVPTLGGTLEDTIRRIVRDEMNRGEDW